MSRILTDAGYRCVTASDGRRGWEKIKQHKPKVVVSDWCMPGMDGLELCEKLRSTPELAQTFFLMATSKTDADARRQALESFADDYVYKPIDRSFLLARVRVGIRMWDATEQLREAAITDGLTGLYNHDYLNTVVDREVNRARRYGGNLAFIMLDLDFFKAVNDTYGHLAGNATLVEIARILNQNVREFDTAARFGGEEFAIVAPEATLEDAVAISQRIRLAIADTLQVPDLHGHHVTASLGIATVGDTRVRTPADLIDLADRALYVAKRDGRNRVVTANDITDDQPTSVGTEEVETLRKRVAVMYVQAKEVYVQSVSSLVQALEEKDPFTAKHSLNVAHYSEKLARELGLSESLVTTIRNAGLLHDVGKVGIPDRVLMKPTGLTDVEIMVMQQLPIISVRILDHLRILESEIHIIRHQREYIDGTGFPSGLKGEQIPIGSRIVLVANAFDAMTTDRVYRPCRTVDEALVELKAVAGTQFDPRIVDAMVKIASEDGDSVRERIRSTAEALRMPCLTY